MMPPPNYENAFEICNNNNNNKCRQPTFTYAYGWLCAALALQYTHILYTVCALKSRKCKKLYQRRRRRHRETQREREKQGQKNEE